MDRLPGENHVLIFSDHGEEFWEHGGFEHNHSLYDELVRAVLWIRPAGGVPAELGSLSQMASLIDMIPTSLALLGLEDKTVLEGTDLSPWMEREQMNSPRVLPVGAPVPHHQRVHRAGGSWVWWGCSGLADGRDERW